MQGQNQPRKVQSFPKVLCLESFAFTGCLRGLETWLRHCDWDTALPRMEQLYGGQAGLQPEDGMNQRLRDAMTFLYDDSG